MIRSETVAKFTADFLKAQLSMGAAIKDSTNPHFKSKFADLNSVNDAVIPVLNANNIMVLQPCVVVDGKKYIETILLHVSGEFISALTEILQSKELSAQEQGSGISYARRYGLQALVCLNAEDDDGNKATFGNKGDKSADKKEEAKTSKTTTTIDTKKPATGGFKPKTKQTDTTSQKAGSDNMDDAGEGWS